jgi:hypothetical protein
MGVNKRAQTAKEIAKQQPAGPPAYTYSSSTNNSMYAACRNAKTKNKKTKKKHSSRIHAHSHSFAHFVEAGEVANAFDYIV